MTAHGDIWTDQPWPPGWDVRHVEATGSTNTDLLAALEAGTAGDHTVLAAGHQTAGRGRLDRRWDAPPGTNLLVSIAFVPVPAVPASATHRVGLAAVAAARAVRPEVDVALKWPNDLLLDGRKMAGILAQRSTTVDAVVVGLGFNVGWAPDGAAALSAASPAALLRLILGELDGLPSDIDDLYRSALSTIGQQVRLDLPGEERPVIGTAVDIDAVGRLVVADDHGALTAYDVGDVVHLRPRPLDRTADRTADRGESPV
jgi:BirA family biotin operon repressor/biotin-[acetyl-CoA-carboxylase] ligase